MASRPGPSVRQKARIDGTRQRAQQNFLARFPEAVCCNCGQRPEPGTIYRFRTRWNKPWCVHRHADCPSTQLDRQRQQAVQRDEGDCLPATAGPSPAGAPSRNLTDPA